MARLVNLTPHAIVLRPSEGADVVIPPSGGVARVKSVPGGARNVEGIPVPVASPQVWGEIEGLPAPQEGVMYIVSAIVLGRLQGARPDVVGPGTGPQDGAVRDDAGRVIAVTRLVQG